MFKSKRAKVIVGLIVVLVGLPVMVGIIVGVTSGGEGGEEVVSEPTSTADPTDEMVVVLTEIKRVADLKAAWNKQWVDPCYDITYRITVDKETGLDAWGEVLWVEQQAEVDAFVSDLLDTQYQEEITTFPWAKPVPPDYHSPIYGVGGIAGWRENPQNTAQNLRDYYETEASNVGVTEDQLVDWLYLMGTQLGDFQQAFMRYWDEEWTMCSEWLKESG